MRTIDPILNRYGTTDRDALGSRAWSKVKNRDYWRHEIEREGVSKIRRQRHFA